MVAPYIMYGGKRNMESQRCPKCHEILVRLEDGTYDCRCARLESDNRNEDYPSLDQSSPDES